MPGRAGERHNGNELLLKLYARNNNRSPKLVTQKTHCGPKDDLEPVLTIMLPGEG